MKEGLLDIQTEEEENSNVKKFLLNEFDKYGYSKNTLISKNELSLFLDMKSPNKKFDINLSQKLFEFLKLDDLSTISISKFISGFLLFYENHIKNKDELGEKIFNDIINIDKYNEKIKICGEIVNIKLNIDSNEFIIKIIYNENEKEFNENIIENNDTNKKKFEFNYTPQNDIIKFILLTKDKSGNIIEIGSSLYSLGKIINFQEQLLTHIEIPFDENEENIAALLSVEMSILKTYFKKREYLKSTKEPQDNISKKDTEKNDSKKNKEEKNNIKGLSNKTFEFPKDKFIIKFNNERTFDKIEKKLYLYYNNEKINYEKKNLEKKINDIKSIKDTKNNVLINTNNNN